MFFVRNLKKFHLSESGSASVEFVLLAIPLFLPILFFVNHFSTISSSELIARTLVRESLRAYVTSPNNDVAPERARQVLVSGARAEGFSELEISKLDLTFQCSMSPCISENSRIRATLKFVIPNQNRTVTAEAEEFISPWQWNGQGHGLQPSLSVDPKAALELALDLAKSLLGQ